MIERGKFRSLTLINWNGFFARTFDLDELVTTLSGGNGAGKSTTMAAFVTALIPDLTALCPAGSRVEIRRMEGVKLIVEAVQKAPDKKEEVV